MQQIHRLAPTLLLLLGVASTTAYAQQTATSGKDGISVNAKENAKVNITVNKSDPVVVQILKMLGEERQQNKTLRAENAELNARFLADRTAVVVGIVERDRAPNASPSDHAAKVSLERGDTKPAETILRNQEVKLVAKGELKQAAVIARQIVSLAATRDVNAAIEAYTRATNYDPSDRWTWINLGDMQKLSGQLEKAFESYRSAGRLADAGMKSNDPFVLINALHDSLTVLNRMANLAISNGAFDKAHSLYQSVLNTREKMAARDPNNLDWQQGLFVSYINMGDVEISLGEQNKALIHFQRAMSIAQKYTVLNSSISHWHRNYAASLERVGNVML